MKKDMFKLGILTILLLSLFGCDQGVGDITKPIDSGITKNQYPEVKKSTSGICHERGSTYYDRTENYEAYDYLEDCLNSGGRLPKK